MEALLKEVKTMKGWEESRKALDEFLQVGDAVDWGIYDYFIEVLPPAVMNHRIVQIGEPFDHNVNKQPIFSTLKREHGQWIYRGNLSILEAAA